MATLVQCPNPACKASCSVAEPNGGPVRCPKCHKPFVVKPTVDWRKGDTHDSPAGPTKNPFSALPAEFGRYRVLKLLGRGGMGAVYLAQDSQLGRQVALKVPFFDGADSAQRAERFVREARSAAVLQHPNVCTLFDAGRVGGRPFLTMAFIAGRPLEDEIDPESPMPQARAAGIARKVALALDHAHRAGIVHRDLKPANVMMTAEGEPMVMDFGLAKRVADVDPKEAKLTRDGGLLGTVSYMAPEQCRGDVAAVGPATDVYALGVMLFEMLTGRTPYTGGLSVVIGRILTAPTPPVREFRPDVDGRLDAACRRAMAKEPADRFASMAEFADALGKYLSASSAVPPPLPAPPTAAVLQAPSPGAGRSPIAELEDATPAAPASRSARRGQVMADRTRSMARPSSPLPRTARLLRRKWPIAAGAAVGLLLTAVAVLWAAGAFRLKTPDGTIVLENLPADAEVSVDGGTVAVKLTGDDKPLEVRVAPGKRTLEVKAAGFKMETREVAVASGERKPIGIRLEPLAAAFEKPAPPPDSPPVRTSPALEALRRDRIAPDVLTWAGDGDPNKAPTSLVAALGEFEPVQTQLIRGLAFSADGRWLASASYDKTIHLRDVATGRVKRVLTGHTGWVTSVAFSGDGKTLVSAGQDGAIKLWPLDKAEEPQTLQPELGAIWEMAVSADGRVMAAGGENGGLKVWKWGRWDAPLNIPGAAGKSAPVFNGARTASLALSADGELLAAARDGEKQPTAIQIIRTADGKPVQSLPVEGAAPVDVEFSRDGKRLAALEAKGAFVWDLASGKHIASAPREQFGTVALDKEGKRLAVGSRWRVELYDVASQKRERILPGLGDCLPVAFSPDGKLLAGGFQTGMVHVWDAAGGEEKYLDRGHLHGVRGLAYGPDGGALLSVGDDGTLRRWDLARPGENQILARFNAVEGPPPSVAWSPDGRRFALIVTGDGYCGGPPLMSVWDAASSKTIWSLPFAPSCVAFSPDGKKLTGACPDGAVRLWDAERGREDYRFDSPPRAVSGLAFSKDGTVLAAVGSDKDGAVKTWNVASGAALQTLQDSAMTAVALRPDGRGLAAGHADGTISVWDLAGGKKERTLSGHAAAVQSLRFTPDGKTLISSGQDGTIRLWGADGERARQVIYLGPPNQRLVMDLDPSGKYLIVGGQNPMIFVLRVPQGDAQAAR